MRTLTVVVICALLCACSSNSGSTSQSSPASSATQAQATLPTTNATVVLRDSTVSFKAARAACPGALGTVSFSLGHARALGAEGVALKETSSATSGISTIVFTDQSSGKSNSVVANGHNRSVTGPNLSVKKSGSVACVMAP